MHAKLDAEATNKFEINPLDGKVKELENTVKELEHKILAKEKENQRLRDDLVNAEKQTKEAKEALEKER